MARPAKSLLRDSHPEIAKQLVDKSLLDTLATGADKSVEWECQSGHKWFAKVYNRTNPNSPTGCPYCNSKKVLVGFNDLVTTHPDVAKLLDDADPATIMPSSNKKHRWKCDKGHIWMAPVSRLTVQGSRCPYCSGRYVDEGKTDLATTHPDIAEQLVDSSLATKLRAGSPKKVEWKCENGHKWYISVYDRTGKGSGCPYCSGRNIIEGVTDFNTLYPGLAKTLVNYDDGRRIGKSSDISVEWQCEKYPDHKWFATPRNRIFGGCPICNGKKVLVGFNDMATTRPDLTDELVDKSLAKKITAGSGKKVEWMCSKGHRWITTPYARTCGNTGCPVCNPTGTSKAEKDILNIVTKLVYPDEVINKDTGILPGRMELDIVIPEKKIAIEYNGTRWHCELMEKSSVYHSNKSDLCRKAGYRLIHVWEDDWLTKPLIIIRMLAVKLNAVDRLRDVVDECGYDVDNDLIFDKVFARNLTVKTVSGHDANEFLDRNHIQGRTACTYHIGLYDVNNNLRALMSLRSPEHNARMKRQNGEWEIQRYATCGIVVGGFSKLLSHAEKMLCKNGEYLTKWVSFSANDISDGGMYEKAGFTKVKVLRPDYKYVGDFTDWKRQPKEAFQLKRLKSDLRLKYVEGWHEHEACLANKLYRIWDAGKTKWEKTV